MHIYIEKKIEPFRRDIISTTAVFCSVLYVSKEKSKAIITFVHILTQFLLYNRAYLHIVAIQLSFEGITLQLKSIENKRQYVNNKMQYMYYLVLIKFIDFS
jgi:hypothetical protein